MTVPVTVPMLSPGQALGFTEAQDTHSSTNLKKIKIITYLALAAIFTAITVLYATDVIPLNSYCYCDAALLGGLGIATLVGAYRNYRSVKYHVFHRPTHQGQGADLFEIVASGKTAPLPSEISGFTNYRQVKIRIFLGCSFLFIVFAVLCGTKVVPLVNYSPYTLKIAGCSNCALYVGIALAAACLKSYFSRYDLSFRNGDHHYQVVKRTIPRFILSRLT